MDTIEPKMTVMPRRRRAVMFWVLTFIFALSLPLLILYSSGHRLLFDEDLREIISVGGIYLASDIERPDLFVNDEPVSNRRLFRQAIYVESIPAGVHQVHTQSTGVQTWVKELPVFPHLVTEVQSFNMPSTSTVRYIAPHLTESDEPLYHTRASSSRVFLTSTTSAPATFVASSTLRQAAENPEYEFVTQLFASTTEDRAILDAQLASANQRFSFSSDTTVLATTSATTTRIENDVLLTRDDEEVVARWVGVANDIPDYFCIHPHDATSTAALYGTHVATGLFGTTTASTELATSTVIANGMWCRTEIRIDRKWQSVIWFEFLPERSDVVILQLQDGIYAVEIDDRSWQNVQRLYAGDYLTLVVQNGQILVRDQDIYFEILTEPIANS